jgi:hypothetical protein
MELYIAGMVFHFGSLPFLISSFKLILSVTRLIISMDQCSFRSYCSPVCSKNIKDVRERNGL